MAIEAEEGDEDTGVEDSMMGSDMIGLETGRIHAAHVFAITSACSTNALTEIPKRGHTELFLVIFFVCCDCWVKDCVVSLCHKSNQKKDLVDGLARLGNCGIFRPNFQWPERIFSRAVSWVFTNDTSQSGDRRSFVRANVQVSRSWKPRTKYTKLRSLL